MSNLPQVPKNFFIFIFLLMIIKMFIFKDLYRKQWKYSVFIILYINL